MCHNITTCMKELLETLILKLNVDGQYTLANVHALYSCVEQTRESFPKVILFNVCRSFRYHSSFMLIPLMLILL